MIEETQIWLSVVKDAVVAVAATVTALVAAAGFRAWKVELVGREKFHAAKELVACSHQLWRVCSALRREVAPHEERHFYAKEIEVTTARERWMLSEWEVYSKRIQAVGDEYNQYRAALLSARVVLGSWVYEAFLPFDKKVTESLNKVNEYLSLIRDEGTPAFRDSAVVKDLKKDVALPLAIEDQLSEQLADAREEGEKKLLGVLYRSTIRR